MSERSPAPGGLALVEALVNTLDLESGADTLDTPDGRARLGITEEGLPPARALRESLRATLLAHAGHPPHREVTPLGELLADAPLLVTVDPADGAAALASADPAPLLSRIAVAVASALVEGTWTRLKACESDTCHWAYYDRSPAGTRPLVLDAGVRGTRENAPLPLQGPVTHSQFLTHTRAAWCRMQQDTGSAD